MSRFPTENELEMLRNKYRTGARVALVKMNDPYTNLKPGDTGTVDFVDDGGNIHINWNNGSSLSAIWDEDIVEIIAAYTGTMIKQSIDTSLNNNMIRGMIQEINSVSIFVSVVKKHNENWVDDCGRCGICNGECHKLAAKNKCRAWRTIENKPEAKLMLFKEYLKIVFC